uniref:Uncharacterized protein n=1 Tax=Anguilla anguilla TaxID=7936 RepID=A0A0E9UAL4_ANGAN
MSNTVSNIQLTRFCFIYLFIF